MRTLLLYGLPIIVIILTGNLGGRATVSIVWPLAFLVMGIACLSNAVRCGRVHCFFTGPVFLIAAVLSALQGWEVIDLGTRAWEMLGYGTFALAAALYFVTESAWGKYFGNRA
jgi:hypothetical protein